MDDDGLDTNVFLLSHCFLVFSSFLVIAAEGFIFARNC